MFDFTLKYGAIVVCLALAVGALAQDTTDEENDEPTCTLAEQIMSSNTGEKVGDCPILEGMEVFQLDEDLVLTERLPAITSYFIIDGKGHTISGNNRFRIFEVHSGRLSVANLHMTDGKAGLGSAIFADQGATVYLDSSTISRSVATYSGTVFVRYSHLYVNNSNISWNAADAGGAIFSAGSTIHVTSSRFESNVSDEGGAVFLAGD